MSWWNEENSHSEIYIFVTIWSSIACFIMGGVGYRVWKGGDYVSDPAFTQYDSLFSYCANYGYTVGQLVGILFATILVPIGFILSLMHSIAIFQYNKWTLKRRSWYLFFVATAFFIATTIFYSKDNASILASAMVIGVINGDDWFEQLYNDDHLNMPWLMFAALLLMSACFLVTLCNLVLFLRLLNDCILEWRTAGIQRNPLLNNNGEAAGDESDANSVAMSETSYASQKGEEKEGYEHSKSAKRVQQDPIPTMNINLDALNRRHQRQRKIIYGAFVFLMLLPMLFFLSTFIVNTPDSLDVDGIREFAAKKATNDWRICGIDQTYTCPERDDATMVTQSVFIHASLSLKFWPDLLIFYGFIYVCLLVGVAGALSSTVRHQLQHRIKALWGFSLGQLVLISLFVTASLLWFSYWYFDHAWVGNPIAQTVSERMARTAGQFGNFFMGFLFFPIARNSIWTHVFGVPWEAAVSVHRFLGYCFMVSIFIHMCFWWKQFDNEGHFPHDIFAIPMYTPNNGLDDGPCGDNWTVPLSILMYWIAIPVMGGLTYHKIRRKYFELFYYSHYFFLPLAITVAIHATSSMYFIAGGGFLWLVDRALRFYDGHWRTIRVEALYPLPGNITEVVITMNSSPSVLRRFFCCVNRFMPPSWDAIPHETGQYLFLNIPVISEIEWHPFTISSAPQDKYTTFHIKSMGKGTWTGQLYELAKKVAKGDKKNDDVFDISLSEVRVHTEGPYGVPMEHTEYDRVVLVAGGIGITPCMSTFRSYYARFMAERTQQLDNDEFWFGPGYETKIKNVTLLWSVRDKKLPAVFGQTLDAVARDNAGGAFSYKLFCSSPEEVESPYEFTNGRMSVDRELEAMGVKAEIDAGKRVLVFVCGPPGLSNAASSAALNVGACFHTETFEL